MRIKFYIVLIRMILAELLQQWEPWATPPANVQNGTSKLHGKLQGKKNSLWQCLTRSTFLSNYVLILFQADFLLASRENKWPRRVELSAGEYIMMHNANVMVHFVPNNENENWSGEDSVARPRVVRRGVADIEDEIDDGGWLFVAFPCISINWGLTVETWEAICVFFKFCFVN